MGRVGTKADNTNIHRARLGGTSFVMDDGDDKFLRKKDASSGPPEYAKVMLGETDGDPTLPFNEHVRLRTRTGHQVLLHNTEDLIYIANSKGTAWIELTSDGKIDIFAKDSISLNTEADFNLHALRNITFEAGANIAMKASGSYLGINGKTDVGRIQLESKNNTNVLVGGTTHITTSGNLELNTRGANAFTAGSTTDILSGGNLQNPSKSHEWIPGGYGPTLSTFTFTHGFAHYINEVQCNVPFQSNLESS